MVQVVEAITQMLLLQTACFPTSMELEYLTDPHNPEIPFDSELLPPVGRDVVLPRRGCLSAAFDTGVAQRGTAFPVPSVPKLTKWVIIGDGIATVGAPTGTSEGTVHFALDHAARAGLASADVMFNATRGAELDVLVANLEAGLAWHGLGRDGVGIDTDKMYHCQGNSVSAYPVDREARYQELATAIRGSVGAILLYSGAELWQQHYPTTPDTDAFEQDGYVTWVDRMCDGLRGAQYALVAMPFGNFQRLGLEPHAAARLNHLSKRSAATFRMRGILVVDLTPFMEELMGLANQNTGSPWNLTMTAELAQTWQEWFQLAKVLLTNSYSPHEFANLRRRGLTEYPPVLSKWAGLRRPANEAQCESGL